MEREERTIEELLELNASFDGYKEEQEILLEKAYMVAELAHKGQTRDDGTPYFEHPKRVAELVSHYYNSEEIKIVAVLHDVLEDTSIDYEYLDKYFGHFADDVLLLTKKEGESFETYLNNIVEGSIYARYTKIADRLDNIKDLKNCPDKNKVIKYIKETEEIFIPVMNKEKFKKSNNYQKILSSLIGEIKNAKLFI